MRIFVYSNIWSEYVSLRSTLYTLWVYIYVCPIALHRHCRVNNCKQIAIKQFSVCRNAIIYSSSIPHVLSYTELRLAYPEITVTYVDVVCLVLLINHSYLISFEHLLVFPDPDAIKSIFYTLLYICFPFVIWSLRCKQRRKFY